MRSLILLLLFTLYCTSFSQKLDYTSHPFSNSWVLTAEGGLTIGDTDFPDMKLDYFGRGSVEYFFSTSSFSQFGVRAFLGGGYFAGKGLSIPTPPYAGIDEYRTSFVHGGIGAVYSYSLSRKFQPYLFGGISYFIFNPLDGDGNEMPRNSNNDYANEEKNFIGEFGIRYIVSTNLSLNVGYSLNYFQSDNLDDIFSSKDDLFHSIFAGVSFYIRPSSDSDGDGIVDSKDMCNDTPVGVQIDEFGCATDSDGDKVPDYLDMCANTPSEVIVDSIGCPVDTDLDGIADYLDDCPDSLPNVKVDEKGCEEILVAKSAMSNTEEITGTEKIEDLQTKKITSSSIIFRFGDAELLPNPKSILDKLFDFMIDNPNQKWAIVGHADNRGKEESNKILSQKRADVVYNYLVNKGINKDRLEIFSAGESEPLADNSVDFGRALNRRTDIIDRDTYVKNIELMKTYNVSDYKFENEFNVESLIFSDGNNYCIQVSSWKTKKKAESEVMSLISKGHKAFLLESDSAENDKKLFRVRIGFFKELTGARYYLAKIRK